MLQKILRKSSAGESVVKVPYILYPNYFFGNFMEIEASNTKTVYP